MKNFFKKNKTTSLFVLILALAFLLRIWKLDSIPVSLFGDEVDVGYHAYSILKTGKDYSGNFMPLHFRSLAEYRTPLYIYSSVPTVAIFGISALGVRLPAALFGILSVLIIFYLIKEITNNKNIGLISAFLLAISPWHLQYSRAGFEVTEMLFFFLLGIYCLLRSFKNGKWLCLSALFLGLTTLVYNTAKLFLPLSLIGILLIWFNDIKRISRRYILYSIILFTVIVGPYTLNTLFRGGTQRIEGISIFNDPTAVGQIGFDRLNDIKIVDKDALDTSKATVVDKLFHNKPLFFLDNFFYNYFQSFSTDFLFLQGDINLRHSIGSGELYKIDFFFMIIGLIFFLTQQINRKIKIFLIFWLLISPIPSALTQGGGIHATRLIWMLPPLIFFSAMGVYKTCLMFASRFRFVSVIFLGSILFISSIFYLHNYYIHYPYESEKWWHGGFKEAIQSVVAENKSYNKIIISGADEPPLIFFLGWSQYPPDQFHQKYPLQKTNLEGFGQVSKLDTYYFPEIGVGKGLYELGSVLPKNVLYLATAKEINLDLILEPQRLPSDLILIKSIAYPSGKPAFYLFAKK